MNYVESERLVGVGIKLELDLIWIEGIDVQCIF